MSFVIGVAAQAQHGKDTLADKLIELLNEKQVRYGDPNWPKELKEFDPPMEGSYHQPTPWTRAAFASNVKKVYEDTFGVDREFTEEWKVKSEKPPGFDMPVRQSLQFIGDGFRKIRSTIWLDLTFRDKTPKIISDVRYVNEFQRVRSEGGLNILVGRTEKLNDDPNGSEAQIRPYVKYALDNWPDGLFKIQNRDVSEDKWSPDRISKYIGEFPHDEPSFEDRPPHMDLFDVFIRNDGSKEDFYQMIENHLVPFIEQFRFGV